MQKKIEEHVFQGMQRDTAISKQKAEFLWDAHNIRLTARHGDTLFSMTNERGTVKYDNLIKGVVLGYCVLGDYLTLFTTDPSAQSDPDRIYRLNKEGDKFVDKLLHNGNLGFDVNHPIETLGVYENIDIQKVYWTDGINQPRLINITKRLLDGMYTDTSFDFISTLSLKDSIHVKKVADSSGLFGAGVIQYAVTYYNKYGQESNISVISPLIPTSHTSRAGSPEETVGNAFKITIENPDTQFEFLRLYSIFRTSKDTTPVCKRVADVRLGYGGNSSRIIHMSEDSGNTVYSRVNLSDVLYKESIDSEFTPLITNTTHIGNQSVTVNHITLAANRYYHFTQTDNPHLILKALVYSSDVSTSNGKQMCIAWDTCTDIYISMDDVGGPGEGGHQIIIADGNRPYMSIASVINYSFTEFTKNGKVTITDNNTSGEDVDYNELLFVGGEEITASTMTQKDGTMFLGGIEIKRPQITGNYTVTNKTYPEEIQDNDENPVNMVDAIRKRTSIDSSHRTCCFPYTMKSSLYSWGNTLDACFCNISQEEKDGVLVDKYTKVDESTNVAGFKHNEHYRLGL